MSGPFWTYNMGDTEVRMREPGAQMSGHTANHADTDNLGLIQSRMDNVHGTKTDRALAVHRSRS